MPTRLPNCLIDLCIRLEEFGIPAWIQGEGLLDALSGRGSDEHAGLEAFPTRSLLCDVGPEQLLRSLPNAVVTASDARRLTLATSGGPIDLLPFGPCALEQILLDFGLSPLAFAFRPAEQTWCDPSDARAAFDKGVLEPTTPTSNPFSVAPRRYWIAGRLASQYALAPSPVLLDAGRNARAETLDRLPQAAPARRELTRILFSPDPRRGLAWLREVGLSGALFPGIRRANESRVARVGELPALRWATWLHGSSIQSALIRLRMPALLARRIERVNASHPIDQRVASLREVGVHKLLGRLSQAEIEGLFKWCRLELAEAAASSETQTRSARLLELEARLAEVRAQRKSSQQVAGLAVDGDFVMASLAAGPGPHVGRALRHLARFVAANPESNQRRALERELRDWATHNLEAGAEGGR